MADEKAFLQQLVRDALEALTYTTGSTSVAETQRVEQVQRLREIVRSWKTDRPITSDPAYVHPAHRCASGVAIAAYHEARKIVDFLIWNAPKLRCQCDVQQGIDGVRYIGCHDEHVCPIGYALDGVWKIDELLKR